MTEKHEKVADVSKQSYCISNCMVKTQELKDDSRAKNIVTLSQYQGFKKANQRFMRGYYSADKKLRTAFSSIYERTQRELVVQFYEI